MVRKMVQLKLEKLSPESARHRVHIISCNSCKTKKCYLTVDNLPKILNSKKKSTYLEKAEYSIEPRYKGIKNFCIDTLDMERSIYRG